MFGILRRICVFLTLLAITTGFVILNTNDINNNVNGDLSVDLEIDDDDYEMVRDDVDNLNIHSEQKEFKPFNRIESNEYEKEMKSHCIGAEELESKKSMLKNAVTMNDNNFGIDTEKTLMYHIRKREVSQPTDADIKQDRTHNADPTVHSYFKSNNKYQAVKTGKFVSGFTILDSIKEIISLDLDTNCTAEDANGIGIRAIKCLVEDYREPRQSYKSLAIRIWKIAAIWLVVYLLVAIPLWCTKGWCCCCLCCKFFKPRETIQEAKNYLLLNPPGILVTKRGGIIHYEPTEREKDCYEEFGHFIRTL